MKEAKYIGLGVVSEVLVCDPRRNDLGKDGGRNDRNDARELAELLYRIKIEAAYHGEHGLRTLKELARSDLAAIRRGFVDGRNRGR
jgi:hypothetical protein